MSIKDKLNWGTGLTLAIIVFVLATLSTVSYIMSVEFYLVSDNHYEEGVQYQETIDGIQNTKNLDTPVLILFDEPTESIKITFPAELRSDSLAGTIKFYRPNDASLDRLFQLQLNEDGQQFIPVDEFEEGRWKLTLKWQQDTLRYIDEKNIFI